MATFERPRTSAEGPNRAKAATHTDAGDYLIGNLNGMALLHLMEMSESGEDDLRNLIELTTADPAERWRRASAPGPALSLTETPERPKAL